MIYKTYIENSDLNKEILFNGENKTLGWILKTHKDYFNKKPNFLLGINSSSKIIKGKKQLFPFTYWTKTINGKLIGVWKTLGWKGKKCFHKSNKIAQSDLPLLIPEGEKCMHFAENNSFLSKHYLPTTWWGGVEQLPGFNFEIFKDKEVLLCPDNDLPGRKAMHRIAYQLVTNGITENIKYLNIAEKFSEQFPSAWDIADGFPDKYKLENKGTE